MSKARQIARAERERKAAARAGTHSIAALVGTVLVCAVGAPVLVLLFIDGSRR